MERGSCHGLMRLSCRAHTRCRYETRNVTRLTTFAPAVRTHEYVPRGNDVSPGVHRTNAMTGDRLGFGIVFERCLPSMYHVVVSGRPGRGSAANSKWAQSAVLVAGTWSRGGPSTVELAHAFETTPSGGAPSRSGICCGVSCVGLPAAPTTSL